MPFALVGGSLPLVTPGKPLRRERLPFFPVPKYLINEQINKLNKKYYISLIVYTELYFHLLYFQVILTNLFS